LSGVVSKLEKHELDLKGLHGYRTLSHTAPKCPSFPTRPETSWTRDDIVSKMESNSAVVEAISFFNAAISGALGSGVGCLATLVGYEIMLQINKMQMTHVSAQKTH